MGRGHEYERNGFEYQREEDVVIKKYRQRKFIIIAIGVSILCATVLGLAIGLSVEAEEDYSGAPHSVRVERASQILRNYPLVDGHNDLPWQFHVRNNNTVYGSINLTVGWPDVHTDIPRLREGQVGAQFWACFVHCNSQYKDSVRLALNQVDTIRKLVSRYSQDLEWVTTAQGIEDAFSAGKIGSMIGLEGGHMIGGSLGNLRSFYDLGIRYMTLTHSCNTPWADNWHKDDDGESYEFDGLSPFGELVVKEMNRLGMMVDLAHVAHRTMKDAIAVSRAPIIFSHSSAYEKCNHNRNVRNDVLPMVKNNRGLIMVTFVNNYINCSDYASLDNVADHIDYLKNQIGVDYVGIGGDYDGVTNLPVGLEDVSKYPDLFAELLRRGWSPADLEKLAGRNLVRVFREVEEVRDRLARENEAPFEDLIPQSTWKNSTWTEPCWTSS